MSLVLFQNEVLDRFLRENFKRISEFLNGSAFNKGAFEFLQFTFPGAVTAARVSHGRNFIPRDVIQLSVTGGATVTWDYDAFDRQFLVVTTSAACTVRIFVGLYREGIA